MQGTNITLNIKNELFVGEQANISGGALTVGSATHMANRAGVSGSISTSSIVIYADTVIVDGVVATTATQAGLGAGTFATNVAGGGSHGGYGGSGAAVVHGSPYDSYRFPSLSGSQGGKSTSSMIFKGLFHFYLYLL